MNKKRAGGCPAAKRERWEEYPQLHKGIYSYRHIRHANYLHGIGIKRLTSNLLFKLFEAIHFRWNTAGRFSWWIIRISGVHISYIKFKSKQQQLLLNYCWFWFINSPIVDIFFIIWEMLLNDIFQTKKFQYLSNRTIL